jgi:hypothetical protein
LIVTVSLEDLRKDLGTAELGPVDKLSAGEARRLACTASIVPAEGCTVPAAWCEAHHWGRPWAHGGRTDLKDGVLLCSWHHHRVHDDHFDASQMPHGDIRFHRRT